MRGDPSGTLTSSASSSGFSDLVAGEAGADPLCSYVGDLEGPGGVRVFTPWSALDGRGRGAGEERLGSAPGCSPLSPILRRSRPDGGPGAHSRGQAGKNGSVGFLPFSVPCSLVPHKGLPWWLSW